MATRNVRQAKIVELIHAEKLRSQQELLGKLKKYGIQVTQATLSRDLKELGVVKARDGYEISETNHSENKDETRRIIRDFVTYVDASGSMVVVKTGPSNAPPVAVALDKAAWPEILGTVAGEDTLFALTRKPSLASKVVKRIEEMLK